MVFVRRLLWSLLAAIAWGFALDLAAYLAGRAYRHHRGAAEMLDGALT